MFLLKTGLDPFQKIP